MGQSNYAEAMTQLNLSYLHLLREVALREPMSVSTYFGVGEDVVKAILDCPITELPSIANPGILLFGPRVKPAQLKRLIESKGAPIEQARAVATALSR